MKTILLVEDEAGHAELMSRALGNTAYAVTVAGTLAEAQALIATQAPDLALIDHNLPDGEGSELIPFAKGAFPILLMTAHGDEHLAVQAIKAGALDYLVKSPVMFADLPHIIERTLREWSLLTERRQMERALRESEERYRRITEGLTDYLYSVKIDGGLSVSTTHNPACVAVTGYTPEEFASSPTLWMDMIVAEDRDRVIAQVQRVVAGEECLPMEHRIVRKDGVTRWVSDTAILARDNQGRLTGYEGVIRDITERKQLERQVLRAQRLDSIGVLASGVAHDLNNVLTPILMSVEMLRPLAKETGDRDMLQLLSDSARRGAEIVQQLLLFGRGSDSPRVPINLAGVIKEIGQLMRHTFPKNLMLTVQAPADLRLIEADRTQIHQVILNLCVNARDAMPQGGRLALIAENRPVDDLFAANNGGGSGGDYVRIEVRDSGIGIPSVHLEKVFDPFFTTKPFGEGTGLGLPTALGIIRSHRGFLTVSSQVGVGSVFEAYLPAARAVVESPLIERPGRDLAGHGACVLIVDDEEVIRNVLQRLLVNHGYRVLTASDGAEALGVFTQNSATVKLVVSDMMMPVMDGAQMIKVLRRLDARIPVVAMSGLPSHRVELEREFGSQIRFLSKPFRPEHVLTLVGEALAEADSPPNSGAQGRPPPAPAPLPGWIRP